MSPPKAAVAVGRSLAFGLGPFLLCVAGLQHAVAQPAQHGQLGAEQPLVHLPDPSQKLRRGTTQFASLVHQGQWIANMLLPFACACEQEGEPTEQSVHPRRSAQKHRMINIPCCSCLALSLIPGGSCMVISPCAAASPLQLVCVCVSLFPSPPCSLHLSSRVLVFRRSKNTRNNCVWTQRTQFVTLQGSQGIVCMAIPTLHLLLSLLPVLDEQI